MTLSPERQHELNKMAADYCGVEVREYVHDALGMREWLYNPGGEEDDDFPEWVSWDLLADHAQAAMVEAQLRENGYNYYLMWHRETQCHYARVVRTHEQFIHDHYDVAKDPDKLTAPLLALEAMVKAD